VLCARFASSTIRVIRSCAWAPRLSLRAAAAVMGTGVRHQVWSARAFPSDQSSKTRRCIGHVQISDLGRRLHPIWALLRFQRLVGAENGASDLHGFCISRRTRLVVVWPLASAGLSKAFKTRRGPIWFGVGTGPLRRHIFFPFCAIAARGPKRPQGR